MMSSYQYLCYVYVIPFHLFTVQRAKDLLTKGKHSEYHIFSSIALSSFPFKKNNKELCQI